MGLICKICFENASSQGGSGANPRITPCGHVFCQPCASTWFRTDTACPVCRHSVDGISSLIPLYDQDAGLQQSSPFDAVGGLESGHFMVAECGHETSGDGKEVDSLSRDFSMLSSSTPMRADNASSLGHLETMTRNVGGEREAEIGPKRSGDCEDVQVRFVLGKVAERWQQMMIERAKLKVQVACLDKKNQELFTQLQRLSEENNALREALSNSTWPMVRRKSMQSMRMDTDNNKHNDHWDPRLVGENRRYGDLESSSPLLRGNFQEPCHMGWEIASTRGFAKPPERVVERLQSNKWELVHTFAMHEGPVHGIAVNPSGNLVATASWDNLCKVYDVHSEEEVSVLSGHEHGLYAVKFSPSKRNVVGTVSSDHSCRLWNAENGECLCILEGHTNEVFKCFIGQPETFFI